LNPGRQATQTMANFEWSTDNFPSSEASLLLLFAFHIYKAQLEGKFIWDWFCNFS